MSNSAQYEEGLVYITCPHCHKIGKYATGYLNPRIEHMLPIKCDACENGFTLTVVAVPEVVNAAEQNAHPTRGTCACGNVISPDNQCEGCAGLL